MPSRQSAGVRRRWEASWLAMTQPGYEAPDDESRGDLTAEPRGVDYLETEAGGRPAMWAVPKGADASRVLFCLHGGGFVGGPVCTRRTLYGHLAKAAGARALLVGYRLPPAGRYPAPADDVGDAYRWLLDWLPGQLPGGLPDNEAGPARVAFAGDSVGAWLAVVAQLRARDQGLPLPAATLLISPCVDMEASGECSPSPATASPGSPCSPATRAWRPGSALQARG
jgi:epsilon-lactone hydrolase